MGVAYDSVSPDTSTGAGATTLTTGAWTVSGTERCIIGFIFTNGGTGSTHTNFDHPAAGGAFTQIGSQFNVDANKRFSMWRLVEPPTGSNTSKGTWGNTQDECCIGAVSYTGVHQSAPVGSPVTASGTTPGTTATATVDITTVVGETVFAVAFVTNSFTSSNIAATPAGGSQGRYDVEGSGSMGGFAAVQAIELVATGTTTTMSVDFATLPGTGGFWGIMAVVVKEAPTFAASTRMIGNHGVVLDDEARGGHFNECNIKAWY
jgi:hypothetical protein